MLLTKDVIVESDESEAQSDNADDDIAPESTDTELMKGAGTVFILSDAEKERLEKLCHVQDQIAFTAVCHIQGELYDEDKAKTEEMAGSSCSGRVVQFKRGSEERELYPNKRRESPQIRRDAHGPWPRHTQEENRLLQPPG